MLLSTINTEMKKKVKINGKVYTVKTREKYAQKEQVVLSKKVYNRNKNKIEKESEQND